MSVSSLKFSPDGRVLASAGARSSFHRAPSLTHAHAAADGKIKLWNAYTGEILRTLEGHAKGVSDVAWAADSVYLASASDDMTVRIWNVELVRRATLLGSALMSYHARERLRKCSKATRATSSA